MREPEYITPRNPTKPTFGPKVARILERLGIVLTAEQRHRLDVAGEYDPPEAA